MTNHHRSRTQALLRTLAIVLFAVLVVVGGYVGYLSASYYRIADNSAIEVVGQVAEGTTPLKHDTTYSVATYNIGFGAYDPSFSFFMEEGLMSDGTATRGSSGTAHSKEDVLASTDGVIVTLQSLEPNFCLLQEVDVNSTRSYHVNQLAALEDAFPKHQVAFASNFHSAFLAYPPHDMHGSVESGLLTLSDASITSATRRSYPIDEGFPQRFFDLDRCFSVARIPTDDGHELVLVNNHMSAYDEGGVFRAKQLKLLMDYLAAERDAGNYVIAGGDWNHALAESRELYESQQLPPEWVSSLDEGELPEGFSVVAAENLVNVASCRGSDMPYEPGVTYRVTVDGFIVSDNVSAVARNVDTGFAYSDHNPVLLTFELDE